MLIEIPILMQLIKKISSKNMKWYHNVVDTLDKVDSSEFSEYETYGNYVLNEYNIIEYSKHKWFRYGSDVMLINGKTKLDELTKKFRPYTYVAFERHNSRLTKRLIAKFINQIGL